MLYFMMTQVEASLLALTAATRLIRSPNSAIVPLRRQITQDCLLGLNPVLVQQ